MKKLMSKRLCTLIVLIVMLASFMCPFAVSAEGSVKVTFDGNGGVCDTESIMTQEDGTLLTFPAPTRDGYTFSGWYTNIDGGEYVFSDHVFDVDTILFAQWEILSQPVVISPSESQTVTAKVGDTVSFSIDVKNAESIQWFLNKNDGEDIISVEGDFFTEVTIENITEDYEGYVYFCEIRNSTLTEDDPAVISPSFTIDIEGVERDYALPEQTAKKGISDGVLALIIFTVIILIVVLAAYIVTKTDKSKKKKKK